MEAVGNSNRPLEKKGEEIVKRFPLTLLGVIVTLPLVLLLAYALVQLAIPVVDFFVHAPGEHVLAVLGLAALVMPRVLPLRPD
jgi:hypothetical protein